ncbi:hypothetical protein K1719_008687 [Acacia pycnantha]|nr:hypothetical protein K1719_008687 [Acacia pycnantha]
MQMIDDAHFYPLITDQHQTQRIPNTSLHISLFTFIQIPDLMNWARVQRKMIRSFYYCLLSAFKIHSSTPSGSEFGLILLYFYLCDRTNLLEGSTKSYNRDLLLFLYLLLIIVSAMTSLKKHSEKSAFSGRSILYLNRHQTEEWKGWMEVLFLMSHYFAAMEMYNAIRVFIAAYVWMNGFGNFSYYYIRKDFSLARFAQVT